MGLDWNKIDDLVKPSPNYETLIKRILEILSYNFVYKYYNHNMKEAEEYSHNLLGDDPKQRYKEYLEKLSKTFYRLDILKVRNYPEFINLVETRNQFEEFYKNADLELDEIVRVIKHLLFWILPSKVYLRELVDKENQKHKQYILTLKKNNIKVTLDILELGNTKEGRRRIATDTGVPEDFLKELTNRADFTRMPYVSGKTVKHYFGAGYDSLEKLVKADLDKLTDDMTKYFNSIGKKLSRSFIELDSGLVISKVLPKIVEQ